MNEELELQSEEIQVLKSIYEGDENFNGLSDTQFQYKYGEDGSSKSFILDISWTDSYPTELPKVSMDTFYNDHIARNVKDVIVQSVLTEAEQYLGMSMTYSLFEHVKEHYDKLVEQQPEVAKADVCDQLESLQVKESEGEKFKQIKKEQLTKAQKKRMWDKGGLESSERPRGWDWIDVIKHLSQTGPQN